MKTIFHFSDYKAYLKAQEAERKVAERGFRRRLAEAVGCQNAYVSQVLNTEAQFSLEQAFAAATFLGLTAAERKFFLLLVEKSRAGSRALEDYFDDEISSLKEAQLNLKDRVGRATELNEHDQTIYYSSWHYLAVHMLATIPVFSEPSAMAETLRLPLDRVNAVVLFLLQTRLLEKDGDRLKSGTSLIHLNRDSPLIQQHHTNWRLAAVASLSERKKDDIHYSTVSTLSVKDADHLRQEMAKFIESYVATIRPSKEETMMGFNLDFYTLARP